MFEEDYPPPPPPHGLHIILSALVPAGILFWNRGPEVVRLCVATIDTRVIFQRFSSQVRLDIRASLTAARNACVYNVNAWCLAFRAENMRRAAHALTTVRSLWHSRPTSCCSLGHIRGDNTTFSSCAITLDYWSCGRRVWRNISEENKSNKTKENRGRETGRYVSWFICVCGLVFPLKCSLNLTDVRLHNCSLQVSVESIRACCAWDEDIQCEPRD